MLPRWTVLALLFAAMLGVCLALQIHAGAYGADIAGDPDEPAHAVTSLLVRDYLAQDLGGNPLRFAREMYAHYPKVAFGHWPPLFYLAEGMWSLIFGRTRLAMLPFVAVCGAALLESVFLLLWRHASFAAACVGVAAVCGVTPLQDVLMKIRPDMLLALLVLWGALAAGEWMQRPSRRHAAAAVAFLVASMLVHQRGAVLVFVPFLLLPFCPPRSLRAAVLWAIAGVGVVAGEIVAHRFHITSALSAENLRTSLHFMGTKLPGSAGPCILLLAPLGCVLAFRAGRDGRTGRGFWRTMLALVLSGPAFQLVAPVFWEERYMVPSLVAAAVLAGGGAHWLLTLLARRVAWPWLPGAVVVLAFVGVGAEVAREPAKPSFGYRGLVERGLLSGVPVALIAGDYTHEGDLIAEASFADPHRTRTVLRATRFLASSNWSGWDLALRFRTPEEVLAALDESRVTLIAIQPTREFDLPEIDQLRRAVTLQGSGWRQDSSIAAADTVFFRRVSAP